jgi:hypothetical protein
VNWDLLYLAAGAFLVSLIFAAHVSPAGGEVLGRAVAGLWLLIVGIGGLLLLFLWIVTAHTFTRPNLNVLFYDPLVLLLVPVFWGARQRARWYARLAVFIAALAGIGFAMAFVLPHVQQMQPAALLIGVPTAATAMLVLRRLHHLDQAPGTARG